MFAFFGNVLKKILGGSRNERIIRARMKIVTEEMNPLEPQMRALSDEQLLELGEVLGFLAGRQDHFMPFDAGPIEARAQPGKMVAGHGFIADHGDSLLVAGKMRGKGDGVDVVATDVSIYPP
ncbi:hypothetical protein LCGC14_0431800 [marine sediment metagenome]|uniref:Uncharacterized protein n=1 Tax=marine sediment metagenome TaxID=412755 RepID=A0A0F9SMY8_9ZZZZ